LINPYRVWLNPVLTDLHLISTTAGQLNLEHVPQVIKIFTITSGSCFTKVRSFLFLTPSCSSRPYTTPNIEGAFDAAEPHFLASGKRDSARLLAEMFIQWSSAGGPPGAFALRGTIPYVVTSCLIIPLPYPPTATSKTATSSQPEPS
jgi:hypothetical protein